MHPARMNCRVAYLNADKKLLICPASSPSVSPPPGNPFAKFVAIVGRARVYFGEERYGRKDRGAVGGGGGNFQRALRVFNIAGRGQLEHTRVRGF